jgi:hypothetical protein
MLSVEKEMHLLGPLREDALQTIISLELNKNDENICQTHFKLGILVLK